MLSETRTNTVVPHGEHPAHDPKETEGSWTRLPPPPASGLQVTRASWPRGEYGRDPSSARSSPGLCNRRLVEHGVALGPVACGDRAPGREVVTRRAAPGTSVCLQSANLPEPCSLHQEIVKQKGKSTVPLRHFAQKDSPFLPATLTRTARVNTPTVTFQKKASLSCSLQLPGQMIPFVFKDFQSREGRDFLAPLSHPVQCIISYHPTSHKTDTLPPLLSSEKVSHRFGAAVLRAFRQNKIVLFSSFPFTRPVTETLSMYTLHQHCLTLRNISVCSLFLYWVISQLISSQYILSFVRLAII
ncbi:uncharacterized protein LOC128596455 [Nycticebus coucang]|uniref:uncharacterized protein LOC128596455 n=1 Tax=Nycticebus coucang TaxID=9470 RepID=UPI00234C1D00|nr:uncharacterized protein LOC128596455 [Nycticebus coucang]